MDEKIKASKQEKRLIFFWIWSTLVFLIIFSVSIFIIAGDWRWSWGWVLVVLLTLFLAAHPLLLIPINPGLLAERARGSHTEGTKIWDKWVSTLASLFWFSSWLLAALDFRFGWTPSLPLVEHVVGVIGVAAGFGLFLWALVSNSFFAEGVRIQTERSHSVCSSGPYRFVRHPGYLGNLLSGLFSPILLGSWWAFIPAFIGAAGFILRTYLEDRTLQAELEGYREYARDTRWRLIPGIW
jgi:protein-S-isoprenylcysteine O-methyltransferase Ste14